MAESSKNQGTPTVVNTVTEFFAKLLDVLPLSQRWRVGVSYAIVILAVVMLGAPPYDPAYKFLTALVAVIGTFLVLGGLQRKRQLDPFGPEALTPRGTRGVYRRMEKARRRLHKALLDRGDQILLRHLRANLFIPMQRTGRRVETLGIYPCLTINMDRPAERNIRLTPDQGVTGLVFSGGKGQVAERVGRDASQRAIWPKTYQITPELAEVIHPDLAWVMSMPVFADGQPTAVFNLDCIGPAVPYDALNKLMVTSMGPHLAAVEKAFAKGLR